jgi:hypothetical protein
MPRIFRAMTDDAGKPMIGTTARMLGVRVPDDIAPDQNNTVHPATGGMSVAPTWRQLPTHRIPKRLKPKDVLDARGRNEDKCWRHGDGVFANGVVNGQVQLRVDKPTHGVVEPAVAMPHPDYVNELNLTQMQWVVDEN